jgi:hypothetical protein
MNTAHLFTLTALVIGTASGLAAKESNPVTGNYLEVRSCDVYTGPCFANAEMNLTGKEGILVWSIQKGSWQGTALDGLNVIAVVHTDSTIGDLRYQPRQGRTVLIVDEKADAQQRKALEGFAQAMAGRLIGEVVSVKELPIQADLGACSKSGCAKVKAGDILEVTTRCMGNNDHVCGNEEAFYPPMTSVTAAQAAYTEVAAFKGRDLGLTWELVGQRSAFLAAFSK